MSTLILEPDQFVRSAEISKGEIFSVFLGAGASITSGIPSAADCIWEWKRSLFLSQHPAGSGQLDSKSDQSRDRIQKWLNSQGIYPPLGSDEEYSFYIEKCYPIEDDRRKFFQRLCEKKQPSIGYRLLCLLHETGMLQSIWTTNFDDLGLVAAHTANLLPIDITLNSEDRIVRPQNPGELLYIKLHGDYKYGPLKNTTPELRTQDATFRERLIPYLLDKHLFVSGYSGRDDSVMETLADSYRCVGAGRLYWCGYGRDIPPKVARLLEEARACGRTAYYIPTDGFDKLLISLADACTKDSETSARKFEQLLKVSTATEEFLPFAVPTSRLDGVIKSNFFRVEFPQEILQFEYAFKEGEKPWSVLRSLTAEEPVVAVPFKKMIYALGTLPDINRVFAGRLNGKVIRVPLTAIQLIKDASLHSLLLSGLTDLLARTAGLSSDKRRLIWQPQQSSQRKIGDVVYQIHPAIRLALTNDDRHYYLSLMPDFRVTAGQDQRVDKSIRQEIGRTYFEKIWNNKFNDYINEWRDKFLPKNGRIVNLEYPANSGTGLIYKIDRNNAFAGVVATTPTSTPLNGQFNKNWILHHGIQFKEPELVFAPRDRAMTQLPRDFHPMRGVSRNRPYDYADGGATVDRDVIRLGVICPGADSARLRQFLSLHLTAIDSRNINRAYLISFPGFQQAFSATLQIPDPGTLGWIQPAEPSIQTTVQATATDLRNRLIDSIKKLSADGIPRVIVLYIPNRWLTYTSYDLENEHYDLHDFIKAYCAERAIATQFINEETLIDPLQCQINWWLSLSYYVKSLRTPWVLDTLNKDTAFAGIGYSVAHQGDHSEIVLGCSHIYNSRGQGLKYRLSKVEDQLFWDRHKKPHLSYQDSYKFGASIIDMFYRTMDEFPQRVVVHKRTFFTKDEISGLKDSLLGNGIKEVDLIEVTYEEELRYVSSRIRTDGNLEVDNFALQRGTCIQVGPYQALLWTHGVVPSVENPSYKFYLGGRFIPGPLRITKHYGNGDLGTISTEILGLTKMNWNSFNLYSQLPATLNSSSEIARIGRLLNKKEGVNYDYRFFI